MLRSLIELKPRDVPLRVALRNTTAVVLPLALGLASGHVAAGLGIAAGALNTMFTDQPGPYRLRMQRMLLTALAAGLSAFVGSLLGGNTALLVLAALAWGIGGGLLVALGPDAARAGLTSVILLVITASQSRTPGESLAAGALIFGGGVLQMLFAIAAWPLQRYRPERHALAQVCRQLGASARNMPDSSEAPPVTQALLDVEGLLHGTHRARGEIMQTFRVLAELVERVRRELLVIGDLRTQLVEGEANATLGRTLEYAARVLDALATALERGTAALAGSAAMEGLDATVDALRLQQPPPARTRRHRAHWRSRSHARRVSPGSCARCCATRTSPAAAANCAPSSPKRTCHARCVRAARSRRCARTSGCPRSRSGMRCAAASASRLRSQWSAFPASSTATGSR